MSRRGSSVSPEAASLPEGILAHHFASLERQNEAMRLGMWLFLATEILLFAGLFTGYSVDRFAFPLAFAQRRRHLSLLAGPANTTWRITSPFPVPLPSPFPRL